MDCSGMTFGNWFVISKATRKRTYLCRCSCGQEKEVFVHNLKSGASKGCRKCMEALLVSKPLRKTHGQASLKKSPTYVSWRSMRSRCFYKQATQYAYYGGRGITVCERWDSFENFLEDMGVRPSGTSLDRKDSNGNYSKDNCRWATPSMQMRNTRRSTKYQSMEI